jgi:hypothetical protein
MTTEKYLSTLAEGHTTSAVTEHVVRANETLLKALTLHFKTFRHPAGTLK